MTAPSATILMAARGGHFRPDACARRKIRVAAAGVLRLRCHRDVLEADRGGETDQVIGDGVVHSSARAAS